MAGVGGVIEDNEPEGGGGGLFATVYTAPPPAGPPVIDVELFEDRLRFMGIDSAIVEEAGRRLRADPRDGFRWVKEQLEQLEPPPKPPTCDCGSVLVELGWRGRATVRCEQCGSRWGVEVGDGTESMWALSGPTEEWRRAHPVEEEFRYGDYQPEDVVEQGLPPMPSAIEPGEWFPLATWSDNRFGAVLYVYRAEPDEFDSPPEEYEPEIEYRRRDPEEGWLSIGSGGGGWINPFAPPEDLLQKYVLFGTGTAGTSDDDGEINFTGGLCRDDVAVVEVEDREGIKRYPVDRARRIFVVGAYGSPAFVRLLNDAGDQVRSRTGEPIELDLS